jgi:predicted dehydrogenase
MQHTIALVGAGGFGGWYVNELLHNHQNRGQLVAVIEPYPDGCRDLDELESRQIPIYADLSDFLAVSSADLICIASPIHLHAPQTIAALERDASVLCEKPLCATIQDAWRMAQAESQASGFVAIGYQWSFSAAIQALKQDILRGSLGRPIRLKSRVYWPRTDAYFRRNRWAGRIKLDDGTWVLDSPVNNATAHYLHNMLYVLGATRETSARPVSIQAELYRANAIENYDTAALRCITDHNVEILFFTTHATENTIDPIFHYEFELATVLYDASQGRAAGSVIAHFHDGRTVNYGNPFDDNMGKIWQCVESLDTGAATACGIAAATPQTLCVNSAQESAPIINFPKAIVRTQDRSGETLTWIAGLEDVLTHCYESNCLPAESGLADWAVAGRVIDLTRYHHYPQG